MKDVTEEYPLRNVRGLSKTYGSLRLISSRSKNSRTITFQSLDEAVLNELAGHLEAAGCALASCQRRLAKKGW